MARARRALRERGVRLCHGHRQAAARARSRARNGALPFAARHSHRCAKCGAERTSRPSAPLAPAPRRRRAARPAARIRAGGVLRLSGLRRAARRVKRRRCGDAWELGGGRVSGSDALLRVTADRAVGSLGLWVGRIGGGCAPTRAGCAARRCHCCRGCLSLSGSGGYRSVCL